ncbi:MAG TPA: alpha-hydroxy-acid oxidizing protein [Microlunatus sp.]
MSTTASTPTAEPVDPGPGRRRQSRIYGDGARGRRPAVPTDTLALERRAQRAMSRRAWAYVSGGAGEGRTMRHNRDAFDRWRIVPRVLHGVGRRELRTEILGTTLSAPLLVAPIGAAGLVRADSDVLIARGAAATGTPYVFSSQGCNPLEDTARAMGRRRSGISSTGRPTNSWSTR